MGQRSAARRAFALGSWFRSLRFAAARGRLRERIPPQRSAVFTSSRRPLAVIVGSAMILFDPIFQGLAISLAAGEVASLLVSRMAVPVLYAMAWRRRQRSPSSMPELQPAIQLRRVSG